MNASTRATHRHSRFEHLALFHDGQDELIDLLAPRVTDAVHNGDAVLVCASDALWSRLESTLGSTASELQFVPDDVRYAQPTVAMRMLHDFARDRTAAGHGAVMSIGSIPFADDPIANEDWIRYEAAIEEVLGHLPVQGLCTYDTVTTPSALLDEARLTHPVAVDAAGRHDRASSCCPPRLPIQVPHEPPAVAAAVASARDARDRITAAFEASLDPTALDTLRVVASELVTNAATHGRAPVVLSAWRVPEQDASLIDVSDGGPGIDDPFFELRPPSGRPSGVGLWIVGQLAQRVTSARVGDEHHVTALVTHAV